MFKTLRYAFSALALICAGASQPALGQDDSNGNPEFEGVPMGWGAGVPMGWGAGVPMGWGAGVPMGWGAGVPMGWGAGVPMGWGAGVPMGWGAGVPMGWGAGVPMGWGAGVPMGWGAGAQSASILPPGTRVVYVPLAIAPPAIAGRTGGAAEAGAAPPRPVVCMLNGADGSKVGVIAESSNACGQVGGSVAPSR